MGEEAPRAEQKFGTEALALAFAQRDVGDNFGDIDAAMDILSLAPTLETPAFTEEFIRIISGLALELLSDIDNGGERTEPYALAGCIETFDSSPLAEGEQAEDDVQLALATNTTTYIDPNGPPNPAALRRGIKLLMEGVSDIAAENHVPLEAVFAQDELYNEACRRFHTPEAYATTALRGLDAIDLAKVRAIFDPQFLDMYEVAPAEPDLYEHPSTNQQEKDLTSELLAKVWEHPLFVERLNLLAAQSQAVGRIVLSCRLKRYWGDTVILGLPDEVRQQLYANPTTGLRELIVTDEDGEKWLSGISKTLVSRCFSTTRER